MGDTPSRRQSFFSFGAAGAGRVYESAASCSGELQHSCRHGSGLLRRTRAVALVVVMSNFPARAEVFVAGGGPAGLAAAIASRQTAWPPCANWESSSARELLRPSAESAFWTTAITWRLRSPTAWDMASV